MKNNVTHIIANDENLT